MSLLMARFLQQVDPADELPVDERQRRADALRDEYMSRLGLIERAREEARREAGVQ